MVQGAVLRIAEDLLGMLLDVGVVAARVGACSGGSGAEGIPAPSSSASAAARCAAWLVCAWRRSRKLRAQEVPPEDGRDFGFSTYCLNFFIQCQWGFKFLPYATQIGFS